MTRVPRPSRPVILKARSTDPDPAGDPFPRERLSALLGRLPRYGRLAWRLGRDPALSRLRRAAVLGAAAYVVSPIDLLPGIIPGIGQLDDVLVAIAALRLALSGLDSERRAEHLAAVGLADEDLMDDARTVGATAGWLVRTGARSAARVGRNVLGVTRGLREAESPGA
ncbi:hypothetical protein BH23CHL8_BH23CHL8_24530 [soil metagenome]